MKWSKFTKNEKILIIMLIISIILVIFSWDRIKNQTVKVYDYYVKPNYEIRNPEDLE